jgi:hypothetical protein
MAASSGHADDEQAELSEAAGGVQHGAGEPAELERGKFLRGEPGDLAELAIAGCRGARDDPGLVDGGHIGDTVAARVGDLGSGTIRRPFRVV